MKRPRLDIPVLLAALLILASCGGPRYAAVDVPEREPGVLPDVELGVDLVESNDGAFRIRKPADWVAEQSTAESRVAIVDPLTGSTIRLAPLQMNQALYDALERGGLSALTHLSMTIRTSSNNGQIEQQPFRYHLGPDPCAEYSYTVRNSGVWIRVLLIQQEHGFYECTLALPEGTARKAFMEVQQSVAASLATE